MAQNKWLWGNFFVGLVDEGREIKPRHQRLAASPPALCFPRFASFTNSDLWFSEERGE